MLHLAYTIWQQWNYRDEYRILVVGADGAGKSTLVEQTKRVFASNPATVKVLPRTAITPTVGLNVARVDALGRHLLLWDVGGHPSLRGMWANYFPQCHGVVFVVDSTDPARVREAAGLLRALFTNPALDGVPVLIVSGKSDSPEALSAQTLLARMNLVDVLAQQQRVRPDQYPGGSARGPAAGGSAATVESTGLYDARQQGAPTGSSAIAAAPSSAATPWFGWDLSETLRGTSGLAGHAYRCVAANGVDGDGIRIGLEWLIEFLSLNARHVESL